MNRRPSPPPDVLARRDRGRDEKLADNPARPLTDPSVGASSAPAAPTSPALAVNLRPPAPLPTITEPPPSRTLPELEPASTLEPAPGAVLVKESRPIPPPLKPAENSAPPPARSEPSKELETLIANARAKLETLSSYQVVMKRQERIGDALQPEEEILMTVRRKPKAVRIEWPSGPHKGREVLYAADSGGGLMHVNMADSLVPVPRLALPPDSAVVLKSSRHPITEAGFDTVIENLEAALKAGKSEGPRITLAGEDAPPEVGRPCHKLVRVTPAGETWRVYLDKQTGLPALVAATSKNGELIEKNVFREVRSDVADLAKADSFDPDKRWGRQVGLLERIGRVATGEPAAPVTATK